MGRREMASWRGVLLVFGIGLALGGTACGGAEGDEELEIGQSIRAELPPCGSSCPSTCFARVRPHDGGGKEVKLWLFHANEISPTSAVTDGQLKLYTNSDAFYGD